MMHKLITNQRLFVGVLTVALLAVLAAGLIQAQEPGSEDETLDANQAEAALDDVVPIQGRLTDESGHPLDGSYSVTASLYDVSTGGTARCSDTDTVQVDNGLFVMYMDNCNPPDIDGRQLYLGIKVGADDEMVDRQPIFSVPYAWSLRPGAWISGTVNGGATVHVENSSSSGRGLRAYATAASGTNYGVVGRSSSPDGYGGYFDNDAGGYALGVEGGMKMTVDATGVHPINVGDRYRDNAIIAWANINSDGTIGWDFGVTAVTRAGPGNYIVEIDADTVGTSSFIPIAIAEVESPPDSAAEARIVSINQTAQSIFRVYITDGNWAMVDNQFVFMVTGR